MSKNLVDVAVLWENCPSKVKFVLMRFYSSPMCLGMLCDTSLVKEWVRNFAFGQKFKLWITVVISFMAGYRSIN